LLAPSNRLQQKANAFQTKQELALFHTTLVDVKTQNQLDILIQRDFVGIYEYFVSTNMKEETPLVSLFWQKNYFPELFVV
jgi:hypothetical protein